MRHNIMGDVCRDRKKSISCFLKAASDRLSSFIQCAIRALVNRPFGLGVLVSLSLILSREEYIIVPVCLRFVKRSTVIEMLK
jgi:hypothetical protein